MSAAITEHARFCAVARWSGGSNWTSGAVAVLAHAQRAPEWNEQDFPGGVACPSN